MNGYYKTESEIDAAVKGFELCTSTKDEFAHLSHLTVAVFYLHTLSLPEATGKLRAGLLRFLEHLGVGGEKYNETVTVFWINTVRQFLEPLEPQVSLLEKTNAVIEHLNDSRLIFAHYSKELLQSEEAKKHWQKPDLMNS